MIHIKLFIKTIFFLFFITLSTLSYSQFTTSSCQTVTEAIIALDRNDWAHNNLPFVNEGYLHNFEPPELPCGMVNPSLTSLVITIEIFEIISSPGCNGIPIFGNVPINCSLSPPGVCGLFDNVLAPGCGVFNPSTSIPGTFTLDLIACGYPIDITDVIGVDIVPATDFSGSCPSNSQAITDGTVSVDYEICVEFVYDQDYSPDPVSDPNITLCETEVNSYDLTQNNGSVGAGTITWYNGDPSNGGTEINPATSVDLTTITELWVSNDEGNDCPGYIEVTFNINPLDIVIDPNFTVCETDATSYDLTQHNGSVGGGTILWYNEDPLNGGTVINPATSIDLTLISELWVVNDEGNNCPGYVEVTFTINPLDIAIDPNFIVCETDATSYDLTQHNGIVGGGIITWYDGDPLTGGTVINPATSIDLALISALWVVNDEGNNCPGYVEVTFTINPLDIAIDPNIIVCVTDATSYDLTQHNGIVGGGTITWYDGDPLTGGTVINPATSVDLTAITELWVSNDEGNNCRGYIEVTFTINPSDIAINPNITVCETNATSYDLTQHNGTVGGGIITWYDGDPLTGGIVINPATSVDLTTISELWVSNDEGNNCAGLIEVTFTINTSDIATDPNITLCETEETSYDLTQHNGSVGGGTIAWYDGNPLIGGLVINPATSVDLTAILDLWVSNDSGNDCPGYIQVTLTITNTIDPLFDQLGPYCASEDITINIPTSSNNSIEGTWSPASFNPYLFGEGTINAEFTPNADECANVYFMDIEIEDFDISAENDGPVCEGEDITLSSLPNGAGSYIWTGPGYNSTSQNSILTNVASSMSGQYCVEIESGACTYEECTDVVINIEPSISNVIKTCVAGGYEVTFFVSDGDFVDSDFGDVFDDGGGDFSILNIPLSQDIEVTVENNNNTPPCILQETIIAPECDCPNPAIIDDIILSDNPICLGDEIDIESVISGGATSGTWSVNPPSGGSFGDINDLITTFTANSSGNLEIIFTTNDPDGIGTQCTEAVDQINLTVNEDPVAPEITSPIEYCFGDDAVPLTAIGVNLTWFDSNMNMLGQAPTPITTVLGTVSYFVSQTINSCEGVKAEILVNIIELPVKPVVISPINYCIDDIAVPLVANGLNLKWFDSSLNLLTEAPTPITVVAGTVKYYVSSSNATCESELEEIEVIVEDCGCSNPAIIDEIILSNNPICLGDEITIEAKISGGASSGSWSVNPIGAGSFGNLNDLITTFTSITYGSFDIIFTTNDPDGIDTLCSEAIGKINLIVFNTPSIPETTSLIEYCIGDDSVILTAVGENLTWYDSNMNILGQAPIPTTSSPGTMIYYVSQTENGCESDKAEILVNVYDLPEEPIVTTPIKYCLSDIATVLTANGENLQWYDTSLNLLTEAPTPVTDISGTVKYFVSSSEGICESELVEIEVIVEDCGCSNPAIIDEIVISNNPICLGDEINIEAKISGGATSGKWSVNPLGAGSFGNINDLLTSFVASTSGSFEIIFTTNDPDGSATDCSEVVDQVQLTVNESPIANAGDDIELDCGVDSYVLEGMILTSNANIIIDWDGPGIVSGENSFNPTINKSGTYTLSLHNEITNCMSQDEVIVLFQDSEINVDVNLIHPLCPGDEFGEIEISDISNALEPYSIFLNNELVSNQELGELKPGTYQFLLIDAKNCQFESTYIINPVNNWTITLMSSKNSINLGDEIVLTGETDLDISEISNIIWSPLLNCDDCLINTVTPIDNTNYNLTLEDNNGCIQTSSVNIVVNKNVIYDIPNIFSPDNDGYNDVFYIKSDLLHQESKNKLFIYNKWGELVFANENYQLNDKKNGWDGTFKGDNVAQGVYVYLLSIEYLNGEENTLYGDVTLIR